MKRENTGAVKKPGRKSVRNAVMAQTKTSGGRRAAAAKGAKHPAMEKGEREVPAASAKAEDPMKQAVLARVSRMLHNVLRDATAANLQQALEAPTDAGTAAYLLSMAASLDDAVRELDPTAAAVMRGAEMKKDLLKRAGGTLETAQVAALLGISRQGVAKRVRAGTLLAIPDASGHLRFPAMQFTATGTIAGMEKVLGAFNVDSPWTRLAFLLDTDEAVGGKRLVDALSAGELPGVLDVVRSFGA